MFLHATLVLNLLLLGLNLGVVVSGETDEGDRVTDDLDGFDDVVVKDDAKGDDDDGTKLSENLEGEGTDVLDDTEGTKVDDEDAKIERVDTIFLTVLSRGSRNYSVSECSPGCASE